ncbi:hypothetical protein IFR05_001247 [Cadophora sp. M221]|nr:hypothetical protein IFR05_001247 [Cadophora sp. M221]
MIVNQLFVYLLHGALALAVNALAVPSATQDVERFEVNVTDSELYLTDDLKERKQLHRRAGWTVSVQLSGTFLATRSLVSAVSRAPNNLDVFFVIGGNREAQLTWTEGGQWSYLVGSSPSGGPYKAITALSRRPGSVEAFFTSSETIYSRVWDSGVGFSYPGPKTGVSCAVVSQLAVTSINENAMEVFYASSSNSPGGLVGAIMHTYWRPSTGWIGDQVINTATAFAGPAKLYSIAAVSRNSANQDIFWINSQDQLIHANWQASTGWYKHYLDVYASSMSYISTLSRNSERINAFFVGTDDRVWQAYWRADTGAWAYGRISDVQAPAGPLASVSMNSGHQEVFWVDGGGAVIHAYWTEAQNKWITETLPGTGGSNRCISGRIKISIL